MITLAMPGLEELDPESARVVSGGNPIALGIAIAGAAGAGFRWGYTVLGPHLVENYF